MATAEQIKALVKSHFSDNQEQFNTIALQIAAYEAQQDHGALAHELRELIEKAKRINTLHLVKYPQELRGLVLSEQTDTPKVSLVVPTHLLKRIERIIDEYRQRAKLKNHGLSHRRKILLIGPPGTGKTMTSRILANELKLSLHTVQVDKLVTKFMGETSAKLRQIFDLIQQDKGVYLFDEFDAIGGERSLDNDVGEMRRVLNSFLQFIEQDRSDSLIIAATNSPKLLDKALFRRFDDVLYFRLPSYDERSQLIKNVLGTFLGTKYPWKTILTCSVGLSHADIDYACRDAIKQSILNDGNRVMPQLLIKMVKERIEMHSQTT